MAYEAVGFDPATNTLAPAVKAYLDARYAPVEVSGAITFGPNITNFSSGWATAGYTMIGSHVFLRGLLYVTAALADNALLLTMPPGTRPAALQMLMGADRDHVGQFGRMDMHTDGTLTFAETGIGAGAYISIFGANYSTLA
jgi:hypothetical protein